MTSSDELRALGHQARDGTWRARLYEDGRPFWECGHPHACIEDAWRCAARRLDKPAYMASTREQV